MKLIDIIIVAASILLFGAVGYAIPSLAEFKPNYVLTRAATNAMPFEACAAMAFDLEATIGTEFDGPHVVLLDNDRQIIIVEYFAELVDPLQGQPSNGKVEFMCNKNLGLLIEYVEQPVYDKPKL